MSMPTPMSLAPSHLQQAAGREVNGRCISARQLHRLLRAVIPGGLCFGHHLHTLATARAAAATPQPRRGRQVTTCQPRIPARAQWVAERQRQPHYRRLVGTAVHRRISTGELQGRDPLPATLRQSARLPARRHDSRRGPVPGWEVLPWARLAWPGAATLRLARRPTASPPPGLSLLLLFLLFPALVLRVTALPQRAARHHLSDSRPSQKAAGRPIMRVHGLEVETWEGPRTQ